MVTQALGSHGPEKKLVVTASKSVEPVAVGSPPVAQRGPPKAAANQVSKAPSPRPLFESFITTLRHSDVLAYQRPDGRYETCMERAAKSVKYEAPLREFLESEKHTNSPHRLAASMILDRAAALDTRVVKIEQNHPKKFVWQDVNEKLKANKTVTALLELLHEPAELREPVVTALKAWSKAPTLMEKLVGILAPSARVRVGTLSQSLLRDLKITA